MPETNSNMRPDFEDAFNVTYGKVLTCTRGSLPTSFNHLTWGLTGAFPLKFHVVS